MPDAPPHFHHIRPTFDTDSSPRRRKRFVVPLSAQIRNRRRKERSRLPDFEIRYFNADGALALVHVTSRASRAEAIEHAARHQHPHDRFEVREVHGASRKT
jgi:hypothetical protein